MQDHGALNDTVKALSFRRYKTRDGSICRTVSNAHYMAGKSVRCILVTDKGKDSDVFFVNMNGKHKVNSNYDLVEVI